MRLCGRRPLQPQFRELQTDPTLRPVQEQVSDLALGTIAKNTALDTIEQEQRVHPKNQIVYLDDKNKPSGVKVIPDQAEDALNSLIKIENEEERAKYIDRLPDLYREVAPPRG